MCYSFIISRFGKATREEGVNQALFFIWGQPLCLGICLIALMVLGLDLIASFGTLYTI
jgi:hypothetical protein